MRPYATIVRGLKPLVYEAFSYQCMRPSATSIKNYATTPYLHAGTQMHLRYYHKSALVQKYSNFQSTLDAAIRLHTVLLGY